MLLSSLKTGKTDLRDTDVQQPNTAETLSLVINSRAFSANNGQFEAGSTTTASSFLPSRPPFLFCSSMSINMTSLSVVSLIALVPESECRMPTLIVSCPNAGKPRPAPMAAPAAGTSRRRRVSGRATAGRKELYIVMFSIFGACDRPSAGSPYPGESQKTCQKVNQA